MSELQSLEQTLYFDIEGSISPITSSGLAEFVAERRQIYSRVPLLIPQNGYFQFCSNLAYVEQAIILSFTSLEIGKRHKSNEISPIAAEKFGICRTTFRSRIGQTLNIFSSADANLYMPRKGQRSGFFFGRVCDQYPAGVYENLGDPTPTRRETEFLEILLRNPGETIGSMKIILELGILSVQNLKDASLCFAARNQLAVMAARLRNVYGYPIPYAIKGQGYRIELDNEN